MTRKLMQLLRDNIARLQNRNADGNAVIKAAAEADGIHVYVYDVIDSWFGCSAQALVTALAGAGAGSVVHLHINSPGGDVFEARAMSAALVSLDAKVIAHIDGICASAATYLALAANEVRMLEGSLFMIHNSMSMAFGNKDELRATADLLEKVDGQIAADYARKTGKALDEIAVLMDAESWFTPAEALAEGFIDAIDPNTKGGQTNALATGWNLSAYANAPKQGVHTPAPEDRAGLDAEAARQVQLNRNRLRLLTPI